jgi:hypothetical protein
VLRQCDTQIRESILRPTYFTTHILTSRYLFKDLLSALVKRNDSVHKLLVCRVLYVVSRADTRRLSLSSERPNDFSVALR